MTVLRPYLFLLQRRRGLVVLTAFLSMIQAGLLLPIALLIKEVFDQRLAHRDEAGIGWICVLLLALYLLSSAVGLVNRFLVTRAVKLIVADLRVEVSRRLYRLSAAQVDAEDGSALHTVLVQDTERLDQAAGAALSILLPAVTVTLSLGVVAVLIDPRLAVALLAALPVPLALSAAAKRAAGGRISQWHTDFNAFNVDALDTIRRLPLTRVLGTGEPELAQVGTGIQALRASGTAMSWGIGSISILHDLVAAAAGLGVLVIGSHEVITGHLSLGQLLSFYALAALLLRSLSASLGTLPVLAMGDPGLTRINALLRLPPDLPYTGTQKITFQGDLELRDVSFGYAGENLLHGVTLRVRSGETVAIVGPNGAGKTTLVRLLLALYPPTSGHLLADGVPYASLDIDSLYAGIGVVLQDQVLHRGTIADVIRAGRSASEDEVRRAAQEAGALEFIDALPSTFATVPGEAGKLLSGGQRQRLVLARALLTRPALLLLDEPTTFLDDAGVAELLTRLGRLPQQPTIVMVTHDPDLAAQADVVFRVRDGTVRVESADLMKGR